MIEIERQINEILRLKTAIQKTSSEYLKNDYSKNIKKRKNKLKAYCYANGHNYKRLAKAYNI